MEWDFTAPAQWDTQGLIAIYQQLPVPSTLVRMEELVPRRASVNVRVSSLDLLVQYLLVVRTNIYHMQYLTIKK